MAITVLVTDRQLRTVDILRGWTSIDSVVNYNQPDSTMIDAPARPDIMAMLQPGNRVEIIRNGKYWSGGPIEKPGPFTVGIGSDTADPGTVRISSTDDSALIAGREVYPDPTRPASVQIPPGDPDSDPGPAYTFTGPAGTAMINMVNLNAGPGALAVRQVPELVMGDGAGLGATITVAERFTLLGDALRSAATAGGGLGFRTRRVGQTIVFEVFAPVDRSARVKFSRGLNNLRSLSMDPDAPTATVALVAGTGTGSARIIREVIDQDAVDRWWRLETWVDQRDTSDPAALEQAGRDALAEAAEKVALATVTVDTDDQRFGEHFQVGDRVAVLAQPGLAFTEVVRSAHLQATPGSGEYVTTTVGSQEATSDPAWVKFARQLSRRLAHLERNP